VAVDRTGRFAPLKCVAFAGVLAPAAWIVIEARFGWLGERPVMAIYQSGLWAEWLLAVIGISLPKLISVRRILGVNRIWRSPLVSLFLWWATDPGAHRAILDFCYAVRPCWFVLGAGLVLCAARLARPWMTSGKTSSFPRLQSPVCRLEHGHSEPLNRRSIESRSCSNQNGAAPYLSGIAPMHDAVAGSHAWQAFAPPARPPAGRKNVGPPSH
jgi:hypothetical protein